MTTLRDMTVQEFEELVSQTVREALEDALEDLEASRSEEYLASIEEARVDYAAGRTSSVDEARKLQASPGRVSRDLRH